MTDPGAYLARPGLARVVRAARARVETLGRIGGKIALSPLDEAEASELRGLPGSVGAGRPRAGQAFVLDLARLDGALRETGLGIGLGDALELTGGPVESLPARRAAERERRAAFWARAHEHPLSRREPGVRAWLDVLAARGTVARLPAHERLLEQALDLADRLPARPPLERTRFAAETLGGNPHALDETRPLTALLLRLLSARVDEPPPTTALERRLLWQRFGVLCDPASTDVLTLGVRPLVDGPLARTLELLGGGHVRITLGQLERERLRFRPGLQVFLCENVTVLTAAEAQLGASSPPLICVGGWPNGAVDRLLGELVHARAQLVHHGDFDWDGVGIARLLSRRYGTASWRFDAAAYRAGVAAYPERTRPLEGRAPSCDGADPLVAEMLAIGRELHEEAVLDSLIDDLGRGSACAEAAS